MSLGLVGPCRVLSIRELGDFILLVVRISASLGCGIKVSISVMRRSVRSLPCLLSGEILFIAEFME
jgi:hypothetical protein